MNLGQLSERARASVKVAPGTVCREVERLFRDHLELRSVLVDPPDGPVVLVNRARFYQVMTGPKGFGWALFSHKPISAILSDLDDQRVLGAATPVAEAGIILTDEARVGSADDVLVVDRTGDARSLAVADIMAAVARSCAAQVEEIRVAERRFRALVQGSADVFTIVGSDGRLLYVSEAAEQVIGYPAGDRLGRSAFDLVHPDDRAACRELMGAVRSRPGAAARLTFRMVRADGQVRWMDGTARNLLDDEAVGGIVVNYRDVTERHDLEEKLRHQAFHDSLTGLPNRSLITDRAQQMLARNDRSERACAALLIDLDRFKDVNDLHGHGVGDRLLVAVARRLELVLRRSESIGRLGGDEFVALIEGDALDAGPEVVAQRLLEAFDTPFDVDGLRLSVSASIGIATGHRNGPDELFRDADIALYEVKGAGRNGYSIYSEGMKAAVERRGWLNTELRGALQRREYFLEYQPAFSLSDGALVSVEALLRWNHPERGRIPPVDFIPSLEESGLIGPVGRWVLHEACQVAAGLSRRGHRVSMAVNVSARQLDHPEDFYRDVVDALSAADLAPENLVLEITESILMRDAEATVDHLLRLKRLGISVAIDDFGTGYSSLAYLARFPVDSLKVDRSFVAQLGHSQEADALLQSVLHLGRALSLLTVAEGVENTEQLEILKRHGCHVGQGFQLARPGSVDQLYDLLGPPRPVAALRG